MIRSIPKSFSALSPCWHFLLCSSLNSDLSLPISVSQTSPHPILLPALPNDFDGISLANARKIQPRGAPMTNTAEQEHTAPVEERIQKAIDKALYAKGNPTAQKIRNFLNGT